jgi:hypothetical protein
MMTVADPVSFDWSNKWLKGEEYFHILSNIDRYCDTFDLKKFQNKTHPPCIYTEPESNILIQTACFTSLKVLPLAASLVSLDSESRNDWSGKSLTQEKDELHDWSAQERPHCQLHCGQCCQMREILPGFGQRRSCISNARRDHQKEK